MVVLLSPLFLDLLSTVVLDLVIPSLARILLSPESNSLESMIFWELFLLVIKCPLRPVVTSFPLDTLVVWFSLCLPSWDVWIRNYINISFIYNGVTERVPSFLVHRYIIYSLCWAYVIFVLYIVIADRRHYTIDLIIGILLAVGVYVSLRLIMNGQ